MAPHKYFLLDLHRQGENLQICDRFRELPQCDFRGGSAETGIEKADHPAPYKLVWLQEGAKIRVTHRVLVSLSIGAHYKDKIYCDVVPMDVSHVLLGRPWQYDCDVAHSGRSNTYSFFFENRHIVLLPSQEPPLPAPRNNDIPPHLREGTGSSNTVLLCSYASFAHEL